MIYYGFDSEAAMRVVSGEHLDALVAAYGYGAVLEQNRRILRDIERRIGAVLSVRELNDPVVRYWN